MTLDGWGWDDAWAALADDGQPARVVGQDRDRWWVQTEGGASAARVVSSGRLAPHPVVGDWILVEPGPAPRDPLTIRAVLPRRTAFVRGRAGGGAAEQVLAANLDVVWVVQGLDTALNARRLERYLAVAWESGATPAVVLTKADLAENAGAAVAQARGIAMGVDVHLVSAEDPASVAALGATLSPGRTVALLGPSGVGKSTLVNLLAGARVAAVGDVRPGDRKGRHTTTRRELIRIEGGALLLDTPGLRELRVRELEEGLERAFPEIDDLARGCRFRDCRHDTEPGCSVRAAAEAGTLDPERLASFRKLQAEAAWEARRTDPLARAAAVSEHKAAVKSLKHHPKYDGQR